MKLTIFKGVRTNQPNKFLMKFAIAKLFIIQVYGLKSVRSNIQQSNANSSLGTGDNTSFGSDNSYLLVSMKTNLFSNHNYMLFKIFFSILRSIVTF